MKRTKSKKNGAYTLLLKKEYEKGTSYTKAIDKVMKIYPKAKRERVQNRAYNIYKRNKKRKFEEDKKINNFVEKNREYTIDEFLAYRTFLQTGKII